MDIISSLKFNILISLTLKAHIAEKTQASSLIPFICVFPHFLNLRAGNMRRGFLYHIASAINTAHTCTKYLLMLLAVLTARVALMLICLFSLFACLRLFRELVA